MQEDAQGIIGVVLAGGEGRRFPGLKGFVKVGGTEIIRRELDLFRELFHPVFISANKPEVYFPLGAPLIGDVLPSKGPMSGVYSSLLSAPGEAVFIAACDMPFLNRDVISLICREYGRLSGGVDAVVPVWGNEPQPLLALYTKRVLPCLEERILRGETSMRRMLGEVKTHRVEERDIRARDPEGRSFVNINTWEDFESFIRR